jgi:hypothetical protein
MSRKERRRALRTASSVPLDVYDAEGKMIIGEGRFVNVSKTGSQLESRQTLPLRRPIRLQIQSPAKSPLQFAGRVVWRKKLANAFSYGIEFMSLSAIRAQTKPAMAVH